MKRNCSLQNTGLSFSIEPVWPDELPLPPGQVDASGKDVKLADLGREAIMQRLNDPDISGVSEVYEYQHELIKEIVGTDGNSLVILPTGAGKTLIAELMIDIVLDNHPNGLAVMIGVCVGGWVVCACITTSFFLNPTFSPDSGARPAAGRVLASAPQARLPDCGCGWRQVRLVQPRTIHGRHG